MDHPLAPLLAPRSIALVGASPTVDSYGNAMIEACFTAGFAGDVYLVNPKYEEVGGRACYPSVSALPEVPDHAVLMIGNARIEAAFADAIKAGVRAVTMFGSAQLDDDQPVPLQERLRQMAREADVKVCGNNGSGFYNRHHKVRCQMGGQQTESLGPVSFISQSGSIYAAISENDGRLAFNLTVSAGQELTTDVSDYMDFALSLESTRAIGIYIETIRQPDKFVDVLKRAHAADIPVVVLKVARSEQAKTFALSHSGALAGDSEVYHTVMRHYGAVCVDDPDELVATLQLLSTGRRAKTAEIVAICDSGGERELLVDIAAEQGVQFADIKTDTRQALSQILEYGIAPDNPLDAWGTGHGYEQIFQDSLSTLLADPNAGAGIWVSDLRENLRFHRGFAEAAVRAAEQTDKPMAFATCYSKGRNESLAHRLSRAGVPLMEGVRPAMVATRNLMEYCTSRATSRAVLPPAPDSAVLNRWRTRLRQALPLEEHEGLALLSDFSIPVVRHLQANAPDDVLRAAQDIGYPVALKSAKPGLFHKSDEGGVMLGLVDAQALEQVYLRMRETLGPKVLVSEMAAPGVELSIGAFRDPQFGLIMSVSAGGVLIEVLRDTQLAVAPVTREGARTLLDRLRIRPLLDGYRGSEPCDMGALTDAIFAFSGLLHTLGDSLSEADVNPLIVSAQGVMAVDALFIPHASQSKTNEV